MVNFLRNNSYIVVALSGAVAATILNFVISYFRRERKILGFKTISRKIVEKKNKELEITYKGQAIERLFSHQVNLNNIGNRALKDFPIRISCDDGQIVEFDTSFPAGANFQVELEPSKQTLVIHCDLLNCGEDFNVGLTVIDSKSKKISIIARAEDLKCKEMVDYYLESASASLLIEVLRIALKRI